MEIYTHGNLYPWKFIPMAIHTHGNLYEWQFVFMEVYTHENSYPGQFIIMILKLIKFILKKTNIDIKSFDLH